MISGTTSIALGVLLVFALCLTACVSGQARVGDWERVVGTTWTLTKIEGRSPLAGSNGPAEPLTLELSDDGRAVGFAGVNRFFGSYESSPQGTLRFAALGSTRMFRDDPPGLMDQEQAILATLGEIDAFRIQRGKLMLLSEGQKRLVYSPAVAGSVDDGPSDDNTPAATPE